MKKHTGGYAGLIALILVAAIMAIAMVYELRFALGPVSAPGATGTTTEQNAISAAQAAKKLLESQNRNVLTQ